MDTQDKSPVKKESSFDAFSSRFWGAVNQFIEKNHSWLFLAVVFILGIGIRWFFMPFRSWDYNDFLSPWMDKIKEGGGLASLGSLVGNYTPPYMFLMAAVSYIPIDSIYLIKSVNILGDISLAIACYFLLKKITDSNIKAQIGTAIIFILPTVILNSSAWGQCDAIYVSFLVWFLYFVFANKPNWACTFFAIAFAFKLQAIFLVPLLILLLVIGKIKIRNLLPAFLAFFALFLPSMLMGEGFSVLWDVYLLQGKDNPGKIALNVANLYTWISSGEGNDTAFTPGFILFGLTVIGILLYWLWLNRKYIDNNTIFNIAFLFAMLVPYVLPKMHDRYFYLADILSIIFVLKNPKKWFVAVIVELISMACYLPFLFEKPLFNLAILAPIYIIPIASVAFCIYNHFKNCKQKEAVLLAS